MDDLIYINSWRRRSATMLVMINKYREPRDSVLAANPLRDCLLRLPLFAGMDPVALARITVGAEEASLPSGTVIYRQGDPGDGLHIVVDGLVKLALHGPHGAEKVVELAGPGECIGEKTIVRGCPHVLTAETIVESRLVHITRTAALEEMERAPVFARSLISSLSDRMRHLIAAFEDCMLRSGTERVIGYLINLLPQGAGCAGGTITLAVKKGIIASQLNLTQEHFSRILHELASRGLIEVNGRNVRVSNIVQLRAEIDGVPASGRNASTRRRAPVTPGELANLGADGNRDLVVAGPNGSR